MTRFIAIVSLEENSGKTTLALNLGLALHKLGSKVLVFDADFSKPNMLEHLSITHLPITLEHVFSGEHHIFDAIYTHPSGLRILPSMTLNDYELMRLHLANLLTDFDYVIVDTPARREELSVVLDQLRIGDSEAILVHTPHHSSKYVKDGAELLKKHRALNLGIVLNHSHPDSVRTLFEYPVIATIPTHPVIMRAYHKSHPVLHIHPSSSSAKSFLHLGKKLSV